MDYKIIKNISICLFLIVLLVKNVNTMEKVEPTHEMRQKRQLACSGPQHQENNRGKLSKTNALKESEEEKKERLISILGHAPTNHEKVLDNKIARMLGVYLPSAYDHEHVVRLVHILGVFPTLDEYEAYAILHDQLKRYPNKKEIHAYLLAHD